MQYTVYGILCTPASRAPPAPLLPRPPAPGNRDPGEVSAEGEEAHGQCLMQDLLFSNRVVACYDDVLTWSSNQTDVSDAELFELATNRLDELLQRFQIRFFDTNPVSIF